MPPITRRGQPLRTRRGGIHRGVRVRPHGADVESSRAQEREGDIEHESPRVKRRVEAEGQNEARGNEETLRQEVSALRRELEEMRNARQETPQEEISVLRRELEELRRERREPPAASIHL